MTLTEVLDAVIFLGFVAGLAITVGRLAVRLYHYRRNGQKWPVLALRDIIAFGLLLLSFLLILTVRAFDLVELVSNSVLWRLMTGIPALLAVWTLAYYELAVIEKRRR